MDTPTPEPVEIRRTRAGWMAKAGNDYLGPVADLRTLEDALALRARVRPALGASQPRRKRRRLTSSHITLERQAKDADAKRRTAQVQAWRDRGHSPLDNTP